VDGSGRGLRYFAEIFLEKLKKPVKKLRTTGIPGEIRTNHKCRASRYTNLSGKNKESSTAQHAMYFCADYILSNGR
jgi:hypothetical protein